MRRPAKIFAFLAVFVLLAAPALAQDFSGWWWNPDESGTGYALEVRELPDKDYDVAYLVWYLYDDSGLSTWYASLLKVTGDTMAGDFAKYEGWPLESDILVEPVPTILGQIQLTFNDVNSGIMSYTIDDVAYQKILQRWEPNGEQDARGLTGWWWDEDRQGIGWFIEARNSRLFLGWYNYRRIEYGSCPPRWYISLDNNFNPNDRDYNAPLLEYNGGQTLTGAYVEPEYTSMEDPLTFTLPANMDATNSIGIRYGIYGKSNYHLTRFPIPDIFGEGCAPVETFHDASELLGEEYRPLIRFKAETPCGSAIDTTSIKLRINGSPVPFTLVEGLEPNQMELFHKTGYLGMDNSATVIVTDVYGQTLYYTWTFVVSDY